MFFAALMSRLCREPHEGHVQCRVDRLSSASRCPHAEQVLELGYQRLITIRSRPARSHLRASWRRNSPQPQSEMAFASLRLRTLVSCTAEIITGSGARPARRAWPALTTG